MPITRSNPTGLADNASAIRTMMLANKKDAERANKRCDQMSSDFSSLKKTIVVGVVIAGIAIIGFAAFSYMEKQASVVTIKGLEAQHAAISSALALSKNDTGSALDLVRRQATELNSRTTASFQEIKEAMLELRDDTVKQTVGTWMGFLTEAKKGVNCGKLVDGKVVRIDLAEAIHQAANAAQATSEVVE